MEAEEQKTGEKEASRDKVAVTAIARESSLKKDWLRPEEDEAWADL